MLSLSDIEGKKIHKEIEIWIKNNESHFMDNGKPIYDPDNLERIKRFANAPIEYINERIELNKEVSKNYHKLHTSILLAGATGFFGYILSNSILKVVNTNDINIFITNSILIIILVIIGIIGIEIKIQTLILKYIGLLRVIRDSEIEIYYLSKIKEHRNAK